MTAGYFPAVSVVICAYNRLRYLSDALKSVYRQTFENFEVLLADDASVDGTQAWIRRQGFERLRYFRLAGNSGPAKARNRALREARGELVAFLDSDDIWHPHYLETMVSRFHRPGVIWAASNCDRIDPQGRTIARRLRNPRIVLEPGLKAVAGLPFVLPPSAVVVRRSALAEVGGFDETYFFLDDSDLYYRIGLRFGPSACLFVDQSLVACRRHPGKQTGGLGPTYKEFLRKSFPRWQNLGQRERNFIFELARFCARYKTWIASAHSA